MVNAEHCVDAGYNTTRFQLCEAMFNMNATSFINLKGTTNGYNI